MEPTMDLVNKYLDLAEAMFPGTPEYRKKFDPTYNPYDPEGKMKKALKLEPYGYRDKSPSSNKDETPTQQPAMKKRGRPKKMSEAMSAYQRIDSRFKKLSGRSMGAAAKEYGDEAKRLQKEIDAQKAENERRQAAMKKEEVDLEEKASEEEKAEMERQMKNFMKKGGQVQQMKPKMPKMSGRMIARGSLSGKERMVNPYGGKSFVRSEEVEELGELSKSTLASYAKKASHDARMKMATGKDFERVGANTRKPEYKAGAKKWEDQYKSDARRREAGVGKAIDRLAKEEVDQVAEATPSAMQVKQGIGIARDKRYAKGNMTGAVKAMDKVNPGLAQHPAVKKELQKQNENVDLVGKYLSLTEEERDLPFKADKPKQVAKAGKYGAGYSTAKHLAQMGMKAAMKDLKKGPEAGKKQIS